jgi:hypothetical protein
VSDDRLDQRHFDEASRRIAEMETERCREIEIAALRQVRKRGPPEAMVLLRQLKAQPVSEAWRLRAYHTLRRLFRQMLAEGVDADVARVGMAAYVDGQVDAADRWLTADILVRPWGVP